MREGTPGIPPEPGTLPRPAILDASLRKAAWPDFGQQPNQWQGHIIVSDVNQLIFNAQRVARDVLFHE